MNQCVPSWNLDEPPTINLHANSNSSNSFSSYVPSLDYEVAELTWENGQLTMHALGPPRVVNNYKPITASSSPAAWDKPRAGGTLESIVDQVTCYPQSKWGLHDPQALVPWTEHHSAMVSPAASASVPMTMDALVPCNNNIRNKENSTHVLEPAVPRIGTCMVGCSTRVGSCSGGRIPCVGISSCRTNGSESGTCLGSDSRQATTLDTWERELGTCPGYTNTTTSLVSPENTISGTKNSDDHDSVCHSRLQREAGDAMGKKKSGKSSVSTKRSRAAAIHNQSERKRRDRINQRMKTLQKLVPNSSKTDKASMLDEVIEHLKQLQAQIHLMNRMNMSPMMLPLAIQQQLQMSMMGMGMGMGMGGMGVMDMNAINLAAAGGMPPVIPPTPFKPWDNPGECLPAASSVMPDPLSAFIARQSQVPTTMDAYSRLAALYQQFQHPPGSASH